MEAQADDPRRRSGKQEQEDEPREDGGTGRAAHRRRLAERHAIAADRPWLLAVAMMRPGDKLASYRIMGESLMALAERDWRLLVVGAGPAEDEVRAALRPLGTERVVYLGQIQGEDLPRYYAAADLLFWPAVNEAYGMALLEAQASGLPVVAGAAGGVPAIVEHGVTGFLAPPRDARALGEALAVLIDQPARRAAMGKAALDRTIRRHHIVAASRILGDTLKAVAAAGPRPLRHTKAG